jgi:hypothetical protein
MAIEKPALCLNTDDPEQKELYDFITQLPNGKKRNTSAFLRTIVDREYQKRRDHYLAEKQILAQEKKTPKAPRVEVKKREIKYLPSQNVHQDANCGSDSSAD